MLIVSSILFAGSKSYTFLDHRCLAVVLGSRLYANPGLRKDHHCHAVDFGSGLYANLVLLDQRSLFNTPSALSSPFFAFIPLVIVLVTLPKDFSSRAAWCRKFCFVNSISSCPI